MKLDPITLEILNNKVVAIAEEMYFALKRASRSIYVKEADDFDVALLDTAGDLFGHAASASMNFLIDTPFAPTIKAVPNLDPGDVIITNDPYTSHGLSTHLPDIHLIRPYFHGKKIVAYGWCMVHSTDMGGAVPSSIAPSLNEIFQEGLRVPPMKFVKRGKMNDDLLGIIKANIREPEVNMGDIRAMLGSLETGKGRVGELIERHGVQTFLDAQTDLQEYTAKKARDVLRLIPDGTYEFWDYMDDDKVTRIPLRVRVKLTVKDGCLELDLGGTDPQVRAAYNVPTNGKRSYWITIRLTNFLTTYDQTMAKNAGLYRAIDAVVPPGILMNAEFPDACGVRSSPSLRVSGAVNGALLKAHPELVPAPSVGDLIPFALAEYDAGGIKRSVQVIEPMRGGMGAMKGQDGVNGRDTSLNNMRNHPVESVENDMGLIFRNYDIWPDSGGPGKWRGGVGQLITVEVLRDGGSFLSRGMERLRFPTYGVLGGKPGAPMRAILNLGRADEKILTKFDQLPVNAGDTLTFMMAGGGGYGDPFERDPERVQSDVEVGFVSREAARRDYGVVIGDDGAVAEAATAKCRVNRVKDNIRADFDFGPEREAWERIFDDETMCELNRRLFELPKSVRQDKRRWIIEQAVPDLPRAGAGLLTDVLADADAARRRLRHAMAQAFDNEKRS
ncbi:MAG: hydantoinase B/oxoprolinase family protein [Rhodospirillales bacterium]|jgi:N-methylhydantoinase B|nr:hydantoinase B/oxoprolinase family protein [Rhodospirillales bacterium]